VKWEDKFGETKTLRLYEVLANVWKEVSDLLNLDNYTRNNIESKHAGDSKKCIHDVLENWSNNEEKLSANYKYTWNGLCKLLNDVQFSSSSSALREALRANISSFSRNTQLRGNML